MNTITQFTLLVLMIVGLVACGRTGELEAIKAQKTSANTTQQNAICQVAFRRIPHKPHAIAVL